MNNFKIGDIVTVYRGYDKVIDIDWNNNWIEQMDIFVGKKARITVLPNNSVTLKLLELDSNNFNFPIGCIKTNRKEKIIRLLKEE